MGTELVKGRTGQCGLWLRLQTKKQKFKSWQQNFGKIDINRDFSWSKYQQKPKYKIRSLFQNSPHWSAVWKRAQKPPGPSESYSGPVGWVCCSLKVRSEFRKIFINCLQHEISVDFTKFFFPSRVYPTGISGQFWEIPRKDFIFLYPGIPAGEGKFKSKVYQNISGRGEICGRIIFSLLILCHHFGKLN